MKTVNVATLKCSLSAYLNDVRNGQEVLVVSHNLPVAKLVPYSQGETLEIKPPRHTAGQLKKIRSVALKSGCDPLEYLNQTRSDR